VPILKVVVWGKMAFQNSKKKNTATEKLRIKTLNFWLRDKHVFKSMKSGFTLYFYHSLGDKLEN
jgi:hypothetical protein